MKKLKMVVTSVIVLAIVGSAFAFNAKKNAKFCTSGGINSIICNVQSDCSLKRASGTPTAFYVVDWDGVTCNGQICTTSARFEAD